MPDTTDITNKIDEVRGWLSSAEDEASSAEAAAGDSRRALDDAYGVLDTIETAVLELADTTAPQGRWIAVQVTDGILKLTGPYPTGLDARSAHPGAFTLKLNPTAGA